MKLRSRNVPLEFTQIQTALTYNIGRNDAVWGLNSRTSVQVHRFDTFLQSLPHLLSQVSPGVRVVLCSLAYEGIMTPGDLSSFLEALSNRRRLPDASRVLWVSSNGGTVRLEARLLSSRTELALGMVDYPVNWSSEVMASREFLSNNYPSYGEACTTDSLSKVIQDGSAWLHLHVPQCIFTHLKGAIHIETLGDEVYQRISRPLLNAEENHISGINDSLIENLDEVSMDGMVDITSKSTGQIPRNSISHLKDICAVSKNESGIRLADHLNSKSARHKLALVIPFILQEGWVAATLASFTSFLFSYGSFRKNNPVVSTIGGYLNILLEPLAKVLVEMKKPPSLFTQNDWSDFFEKIVTHLGMQHGQAHLSTLHVWAVHCFGCDPMPQLIFAPEFKANVHANIIWPHEQSEALKTAAGISQDERVSNQCMVLLALGCTGFFRIGELPSLLSNDIQETPTGLRIRIDPGRGTHGGKSRAARRDVFLYDPEAICIILEWRDRRNAESKFSEKDKVYLFGDPHAGQKLYRFGHCARLVNSLLKSVTGCESVSFHTCRHTSGTFRGLRLLTQRHVQSAIAPLHILCHELGHESELTLWETYFHSPEFALRTAMDRAPSVINLSANEAAFWTHGSMQALRKKKSVCKSDHKDDFYSLLVHKAAFIDHSAGFKFGDSYMLPKVAPPSLDSSAPITFEWVLRAVALIQSGLDISVACSRLSCTEHQLVRVCHAANSVLQTMQHRGCKVPPANLRPNASSEHALLSIQLQISSKEWSFPNTYPSSLSYLTKYLNKRGIESRSVDAANSWLFMKHHQALSLEDLSICTPLLSLLKESGFPPGAIVVRTTALNHVALQPAGGLTNKYEEEKLIDRLMLEALGTTVRIERIQKRRGFPRHYFMLGRSILEPDKHAPAAQLCMSATHGIFLVLNVFILLKSIQRLQS